MSSEEEKATAGETGRDDRKKEKVGEDNPAAKKQGVSTKEEKKDGTTEGPVANAGNDPGKGNADEDTLMVKAETEVKEEKEDGTTDGSVAFKNNASDYSGEGNADEDTIMVKAETEVKEEKEDGEADVKEEEVEENEEPEVQEEDEENEEPEVQEEQQENEEPEVQEVQQGNGDGDNWKMMMFVVGAELDMFLTEEDVRRLSGRPAPFTATDWENGKSYVLSLQNFNNGYRIAGAGWTEFVEDMGVKVGDDVGFENEDGRLFMFKLDAAAPKDEEKKD